MNDDLDRSQLGAVRDFCVSHGVEVTGDLTATLVAGGRSNLTSILRDGSGQRWVLRRPPAGDHGRGTHDVGREHRLIAALADTPMPVPQAVGLDKGELLGVPFYVMSHVDGLVLRTEADAAALPPSARHRLGEELMTVQARLHTLDATAIELGDLGRGVDYVARQLRVFLRQLDAQQARSEIAPLIALGHQLALAVPEQPRVSLVHADLRLDNLIVRTDGSIAALLDWELATRGDPLADLATTLAYWVEDVRELYPLEGAPTALPGFASRAELIASYRTHSELDLEALPVLEAFAVWRYAAILEGVYRRNLDETYGASGTGGWERFAWVVPALTEVAARLAKRAEVPHTP